MGQWERGDARPNEEHLEAIRECIPAGIGLEQIVDDTEATREWHEQLTSQERRIFGSDKLRLLRERPRTPDELPREAGMNYFEGQQRQFVRQLKVGKQIGEAEKPGGRAVQVYYLEGDERRAVRRFIDANEEIVAKALAQQVSRFQHEWSDFLYGLLEEEWRFWLCR